MNSLSQSFKRLSMAFLIGLSIILTVFILNQFMNLFDLLHRFHPVLAWGLTILLAILFIYYVIKFLILYQRSSKLAVLPENPTQQELDNYYTQMVEFLKRNPHLKSLDFETSNLSKAELVEYGFKELDQITNPIIKQNASEIFLTTAISQNGSLDGIAVLISMVKMIWKLANIYQTRPSIKSLLKLYSQVGSVVFMARTLEDSEIIESQIEPLIAAIFGESVASAIPGMVPITNLVVSSMMEGSLNALLTLRVGIITQRYLGMEVPESASFIQKNASLQALSHLGNIIKDNGKLVAKSMFNAAKNATSSTAKKWFGFQ